MDGRLLPQGGGRLGVCRPLPPGVSRECSTSSPAEVPHPPRSSGESTASTTCSIACSQARPATTVRLPRIGVQVTWRFGRSAQRTTSIPMGSSPAPAGGRRKGPEFVAGHSGYWWACPETAAANVNSGHIAFQRSMGDVVLGASVHGITAQSRKQFVNCSFSLSWWAPDPWPLHQALRPLKPPPEQPSEGRTSQGRETGHKGNASRQCRVFIA